MTRFSTASVDLSRPIIGIRTAGTGASATAADLGGTARSEPKAGIR